MCISSKALTCFKINQCKFLSVEDVDLSLGLDLSLVCETGGSLLISLIFLFVRRRAGSRCSGGPWLKEPALWCSSAGELICRIAM